MPGVTVTAVVIGLDQNEAGDLVGVVGGEVDVEVSATRLADEQIRSGEFDEIEETFEHDASVVESAGRFARRIARPGAEPVIEACHRALGERFQESPTVRLAAAAIGSCLEDDCRRTLAVAGVEHRRPARFGLPVAFERRVPGRRRYGGGTWPPPAAPWSPRPRRCRRRCRQPRPAGWRALVLRSDLEHACPSPACVQGLHPDLGLSRLTRPRRVEQHPAPAWWSAPEYVGLGRPIGEGSPQVPFAGFARSTRRPQQELLS